MAARGGPGLDPSVSVQAKSRERFSDKRLQASLGGSMKACGLSNRLDVSGRAGRRVFGPCHLSAQN